MGEDHIDVITALTWAIKTSFLVYLSAVKDAVIGADGVDHINAGFRFPRSAEPRGLDFAGALTISAHQGRLSLTVGEPRIHRVDSGVVMRATTASGPIDVVRLLDYPRDDRSLRRDGGELVDVTLTAEGARLFGGAYGVGTRMAPIRLQRAVPVNDGGSALRDQASSHRIG